MKIFQCSLGSRRKKVSDERHECRDDGEKTAHGRDAQDWSGWNREMSICLNQLWNTSKQKFKAVTEFIIEIILTIIVNTSAYLCVFIIKREGEEILIRRVRERERGGSRREMHTLSHSIALSLRFNTGTLIHLHF